MVENGGLSAHLKAKCQPLVPPGSKPARTNSVKETTLRVVVATESTGVTLNGVGGGGGVTLKTNFAKY